MPADTVKHTPRPWTIIPAVEYDGDDEDCVGSYTSPAGIEGSDGNPVCAFGLAEGSGFLFENEADYHLIAAAPDLLDVAKRILDRGYVSESIEEERADHLALAAAVAKAEGRSP